VVLRGNLCPDGAVLKQTAASPHLCEHTGPHVCVRELSRCTTPSTAWTCRSIGHRPGDESCGPKGAPGFPEWGTSDAQGASGARYQRLRPYLGCCMSGTSFRSSGAARITRIEHHGGPLGVVETGDLVTLSVAGRSCTCTSRRQDPPAREPTQTGPTTLYARLRKTLPGSVT
jgi:dihydroxy-acid dehydratase